MLDRIRTGSSDGVKAAREAAKLTLKMEKRMKMKRLMAAYAVLMFAPGAFAAVIDFEDLDVGAIPGEELVYEVDDVTVTIQGTGLRIRTLGGSFDAEYGQTRYLSTSGDSAEITVTFTNGSADFITILNPINGTVTGEVDIINAEALDDDDIVVDSKTSSDALLTLDGPGIARATYDDDDTGYVIGYIEFDVTPADGTAAFKVTKTFSDGRTDEVDVSLSCNGGLPLEQDFTIAGGGEGVNFIVTLLPSDGSTTCEVTESGGPAGYTPVYNGGSGCKWDNVKGGQFFCDITNTADPATYTVLKDWVVTNSGGDEVVLAANVTITCDRAIADTQEDDGSWSKSGSLGDGQTLVATVDVTTGPASCSASETITQSGVESSADKCGSTSLSAGGSHTCTFTNTVFFEGIPTLSQYGMAILVLLTLGLGLVSVRRLA